MLDAKGLLDQFLGGQSGQGGKGGVGEFMKGAGGGALAGGLAAILLGSKTGRKIGGEALKLGGMAAVGALAYKAYRDWQAGKQATAAPPAQQSVPMLPAPSGTPFNPSTESGQQKLARHLLRAMIAAAEIYTASLLAIDIDNAAERGYLAMLAARLRLDDALVAHLQQTVAAASGKAVQPAG